MKVEIYKTFDRLSFFILLNFTPRLLRTGCRNFLLIAVGSFPEFVHTATVQTTDEEKSIAFFLVFQRLVIKNNTIPKLDTKVYICDE